MLQFDLTKYEKMRFKNNGYCKICKTLIHPNESFEMLKTYHGKCVIYSFFHSECICNNEKFMKEK